MKRLNMNNLKVLNEQTGEYEQFPVAGGEHSTNVSYDNANGNLTSTNVQSAIDELDQMDNYFADYAGSESLFETFKRHWDNLTVGKTTKGSILNNDYAGGFIAHKHTETYGNVSIFSYNEEQCGFFRMVNTVWNDDDYVSKTDITELNNRLGDIRYKKLETSNSEEYNKPWLVLENNISQFVVGVNYIGTIVAGGNFEYWGARAFGSYASFLVHSYDKNRLWQVTYTNGVWAHEDLVTTSDLDYHELTSGFDLNNAIQYPKYRAVSTVVIKGLLNMPEFMADGSGTMTLFWLPASSNNSHGVQKIFYGHSDGIIYNYERYKRNNTWTEWFEIATKSDLAQVFPPKNKTINIRLRMSKVKHSSGRYYSDSVLYPYGYNITVIDAKLIDSNNTDVTSLITVVNQYGYLSIYGSDDKLNDQTVSMNIAFT